MATSAARPGAQLILSDGAEGRPDDGAPQTSEDEEDEQDADDGPSGDADPSADADTATDAGSPTDADGQALNGEDEEDSPGAQQDTSKGDREPGPPAMPRLRRRPPRANSVYRMTPPGYVTSVFSKAVVILQMAYAGDGKVLLATGNDAQLLQLDLHRQEAVVLYKSDRSVQASAVVAAADGTTYAGFANPGAVIALAPAYTSVGEYISAVIDAGQISHWGKLQIKAESPDPAMLTVSTRSGNTEDPEQGGWQDWSEPVAATEDVQIDSIPGRFLQYRLQLASRSGTDAPLVKRVKLAHTVPNLPPRLESVKVVSAAKSSKRRAKTESISSGSGTLKVKWGASDANKDELLFEVFIRPVGNTRWISIADELDKDELDWNTLTVADGPYEIKVTASDSASNPKGSELSDSRISRQVVVDNTPPEIIELNYDLTGKDVHFRIVARDADSAIGSAKYYLNSAEDFQTVVSIDGVFDSRQETLEFDLPLEPGSENLVSICIEDVLHNTVYRNVTIVVPDDGSSDAQD